MAYSALTTGEITEAEATKQQIFQKIKDNFEDHESRLFTIEKGLFERSGFANDDTQSTTYVDIANVATTITKGTRGVLILLESEDQVVANEIALENTSTSLKTARGLFRLRRDSTDLAYFDLRADNAANAAFIFNIPAPSYKYFDHVAAGTYTYRLAFRVTVGTSKIYCENIQMRVVQL